MRSEVEGGCDIEGIDDGLAYCIFGGSRSWIVGANVWIEKHFIDILSLNSKPSDDVVDCERWLSSTALHVSCPDIIKERGSPSRSIIRY